MWAWLRRNSEPLEGLGAAVTALAAVAALVIIPIQIRSADRIQRDQTAREIYREFLNLTVQKPELVALDYCAISDAKTKIAYEAYVEYLLYTTEQMVNASADWREPMAGYLADHLPYICESTGWQRQSEGVYQLITGLQAGCADVPACPAE